MSSFCCLEICIRTSFEGGEVVDAVDTKSRRAIACSRVWFEVSRASLRDGSVIISSIDILVRFVN